MNYEVSMRISTWLHPLSQEITKKLLQIHRPRQLFGPICMLPASHLILPASLKDLSNQLPIKFTSRARNPYKIFPPFIY